MANNDFDKLVLPLSTSLVSTDILHNLTSFLQTEDNESFVAFVLQSYQSLSILEKWAWKVLSEEPLQWINQSFYIDFLHVLTSFNRSLVFDCDPFDNDSKLSLLLPESIDQINLIFHHIEQSDDEDSPYLILINRIFDNHSSFLYDHLEYCKLLMIDHIGGYLVRNYIMNKQFKLYLWHLQKPQITEIKITAKMLFYIKTCSFYFYVYLSTRFQNFFYTADEIIRYLGDDFLRIIHTHVPTINQWNKEFLACVAHLIPLVGRCCWWGGNTALANKVLLPTEQMACEHVQDLMNIVGHVPIYAKITNQRRNDETILLESTLLFLYGTADIQNVNWLFRSNTTYQRILLDVGEIRTNDIICMTGYGILSLVLADEQIKALKMDDNVASFLFNMLEKARNDALKMYKYVPIFALLQGQSNNKSSSRK